MTELRELVAREIALGGYPSEEVAQHMHDNAALQTADYVLAIPRIAAALKLLDEQERLNLGSSIGTRG